MAAIAWPGASDAQQPKVNPSPTLDAEALRIPNSIGDTGARKIEPSQKTAPAAPPPNKFGVGQYDLEFKAGHTSDINPRTGFDSGETSNLQKIRPGKQESVTPDYFGLKLKVPAH
jgi:hypothetical protein